MRRTVKEKIQSHRLAAAPETAWLHNERKQPDVHKTNPFWRAAARKSTPRAA